MYVLSFFTDGGVPKTGLTPTIKIIDIPSGTIIVNGSNMTELNNGFYYYNFIIYDSTKDYAILCDGTAALLNSDRYVYSGNENFVDDISNGVWNENISEHTNTDTFGLLTQEIAGLVHSNIQIDEPIYDSDNNMIGARIRLYSNSTSVGTLNNILATYNISVESDGPGKFISWKQEKEN